MQGGKLLKITVCCENSAKENFLDAFEESVILEDGRENTIIQVETFEEGFLQWILSQKGNIIVLEPIELREVVCKILEKTLKKYEKVRSGGRENEDV